MTGAQTQVPNELYQRAKGFAAERELLLAEVTRRRFKMLFDGHAPAEATPNPGHLPRVDGDGLRVDLRRLRDLAALDQETRGQGASED